MADLYMHRRITSLLLLCLWVLVPQLGIVACASWNPLTKQQGKGPGVVPGKSDHEYQPHDPIRLYANHVGSFENPR
jgi:hypothetical protein